MALTNVGSNGQPQSRTITYHSYADGTKLCNLYADCTAAHRVMRTARTVRDVGYVLCVSSVEQVLPDDGLRDGGQQAVHWYAPYLLFVERLRSMLPVRSF